MPSPDFHDLKSKIKDICLTEAALPNIMNQSRRMEPQLVIVRQVNEGIYVKALARGGRGGKKGDDDNGRTRIRARGERERE
jgi:hypothetical protein